MKWLCCLLCVLGGLALTQCGSANCTEGLDCGSGVSSSTGPAVCMTTHCSPTTIDKCTAFMCVCADKTVMPGNPQCLPDPAGSSEGCCGTKAQVCAGAC